MDTVLFSGDDLYQRLQQKISIALFCSRFRRLHHVIRFHKVDVKAIMMNVRFQTSLLALLSAILPVTAFSAVPENCPQVPSSPLEQGESKKQPPRLNFHKVLQKAGKTVFRPGGSQATDTLHEWSGLEDGCTAIEISAGLDTGGMALAANRGCQVLLMDQDEERLVKAAKVAKKRGLGDLIRTKKVDMAHIDDAFDEDEQFEAAVVEASLTHYPNSLKVKILQDLRKHSNQILLHEIGLRNVVKGSEKALQVQRDVGQALGIGFHPLTVDGWRKILDECGYEITNIEGGPMRVLSPTSMLRDEGPSGVAKIAWNLATHKDLRERVVSTKAVINSNSDTLGYVIVRAVKKE
jgi:hypothetical protein